LCPRQYQDREAVLGRAARAGVDTLVVTGCCERTSRVAHDYVSTGPSRQGCELYFTTGVHPHNAKLCGSETLEDLRRMAAHPRCVAIGECGLDFNRNFSPPDVQERWFEEQVKLAVELRMPLFLHCREAMPSMLEILGRHRLTAPAVMHCFSGSREELEAVLALGCHVGITGWVCDDRPERGGAELANLLSTIPRDKLMIETDGPYLTPRSIKPSRSRPKRNEPALLPVVCQAVAEALGSEPHEVAAFTTTNAERCFRLMCNQP